MTSPLAYINDTCFDPRACFGFSNFCIGCEHISWMRSALNDTTWGRLLVGHVCEPRSRMKSIQQGLTEEECPDRLAFHA